MPNRCRDVHKGRAGGGEVSHVCNYWHKLICSPWEVLFIILILNIKIIKSTSFQKEKTSKFTFCLRRTHSMTKKAVAMLSMMCSITSTSSCSLIASMRKIPEKKRKIRSQFLFFSYNTYVSNTEEINPSLHNCVLDMASPYVSNVALTCGDENHQNRDEGK